MSKPTVGFVLPSHRLPHEPSRALAHDLRATAAAAADVGADTLWVWDHMLKAPVYSDAWHDPLLSLAAVADHGLRLGTGILVAPVRPPVQTAMAVATLQSLSRQTMRLGIGTGWNPPEFEAAGVALGDRGALTDEFLAVLGSVFGGESSFEGRFHRYSGLETGYIGAGPEIWIAGGSRRAGRGVGGGGTSAQEQTAIAPAVAARIRAHGRWLLRPTAEMEDFRRDVAALDDIGGGAAPPELGTINVGCLVDTDDPDAARQEQMRVLGDFVSDQRPLEYLEARYLIGTMSEVRERVAGWAAAGLAHIGLYLLGDVPAQVRLARTHLADLLDFDGPRQTP